MLVIGVTGMPGAGKDVFYEVATNLGFIVIKMGELVREETRKRGLPIDAEHVGRVAVALREERGTDAIAKLTIQKIKKIIEAEKKPKIIFIEGIRSLDEVKTLKSYFGEMHVLAIHASPKTRYQRIIKRKRVDDNISLESIIQRDLRELSFGIGNVIAMADFILINENKTLEDFRTECKKFIDEILRLKKMRLKK